MITINEKLIPPEQRDSARAYAEARQVEYDAIKTREAKEKRDRQARQYPPLKTVMEKLKKINVPHVQRALLKRIHIALSYLRTPPEVHAPGHVPTLEEALAILGRAYVNVSLMTEVGKILRDYSGYSILTMYPREVFELKTHCEESLKLAEDMVRAITFQMIKEDGRYEKNLEPKHAEHGDDPRYKFAPAKENEQNEPRQDGHTQCDRPEPGQTEQGDTVQ